MATDADFAAHVLEQLAELGGMSTRRMFGEYALYRYGQVVGLLCDNQMFLKPTEAARALLTEPAYGHPFPGASPHLLVNELLDDRESLAKLVRVTSENLPANASRKPRKTHTTDADGTALKANLEVRYNLANNLFVMAEFNYLNFDTDGTEEDYVYAGPDEGDRWTIDHGIQSDQTSVLLAAGIHF